jgi:hypothetical protein
VDNHPAAPTTRAKLSPEAIEKVRREWGPWCRTLTSQPDYAEAATDLAITYLEARLPAVVTAAAIRLRSGLSSDFEGNRSRVLWELAHYERARQEAREMGELGLISREAAAVIENDYATRSAALSTWAEPLRPRSEAVPTAAPSRPAQTAAAGQTVGASHPAPAAVPAAPAHPPISLRDLFAEHSVLILASLGAFLLVVATVLFELYGTVGLGGGVRLAAVVALDIIFAAAGYVALRRPDLRSVGQIYTALAAVLLPLVGLAAWTFLELGSRGITVDQALAVTGAACAFVYGGLAISLGLRSYGLMSGVAIAVAAWGVSGAIGGEHWRPAWLALTPLVFGAWERTRRDPVFQDFPWFAHGTGAIAVLLMLTHEPTDWLWPATLAALAFAYLAWQALSPHWSRVWTGEAALVLAAAALVGPMGINSYHFLFPMLVAVPLIGLTRTSEELGVVGRIYRAHPAHLHLAVAAGFAIACWQNALGETWPLASVLWFAVSLYAADFLLGRTELTGYTVRAALPLALAATGRALELGPWTATLTAVALLLYVAPFASPAFKPLTRHASSFLYAALVLVAVELIDAAIGPGRWEIPAALVVSSVAFGIAGEIKAVRLADWTARALFGIAWFVGVDALNAQGWRGPFDALLALVYAAIAQVRALSRHSVAVAGRRWFVHITALAALLLCFTGPDNSLWWRFTVAFGLIAAGYWWQALARANVETPWIAWGTLAMAAISLVMATVTRPWQGAAVAVAALALTAVWTVLRRVGTRPNLEESAFTILFATTLIGGVLALRQEVPQWHQSATAVAAAAFLLAWARIPTVPFVRRLRPLVRAAAAASASTAVLLGAAVLNLDAAYVGLIALAIAAAHAEWHVRAKQGVEYRYAIAAVLLLAPVIYLWPYAHALPALMAIEFVALAALTLSAGIRRHGWLLAVPASLLLVPALHLAVIALGRTQDVELEEIWMAGLAWIVGLAGLMVRVSFGRRWALSVEAGGVSIAVGALVAMSSSGYPDPTGIALIAYAPLVYTAAIQERARWVLPPAAAAAMLGEITLLHAHNEDTIYYAAALGVLGLLIWVAGRISTLWLGHDRLVDMHRYLGLGLLGVAGAAGFFFPDRTGAHSLGASLAAAGLLITGGVLWLDSRTYKDRPNFYLAMIAATTAGYFVARDIGLPSWQLVPPGLGLVACGIRLRTEREFRVDVRIRQLIVALGLGLVMGWAGVLTVAGDMYWLVVLLIQGAITVGLGIVLRSRVLLAGGGAAMAVVSLRALLTVAQAGYLFAAFAAVALVLLVAATALALGRDRYRVGAQGMREELAHWD